MKNPGEILTSDVIVFQHISKQDKPRSSRDVNFLPFGRYFGEKAQILHTWKIPPHILDGKFRPVPTRGLLPMSATFQCQHLRSLSPYTSSYRQATSKKLYRFTAH